MIFKSTEQQEQLSWAFVQLLMEDELNTRPIWRWGNYRH
ncbi:hypothetical protein JCM19237_1061 [Photobacterium aphoticum]|uniref:Uncharacterized protein n=1 Tax=Photobacterium aphoticum TaxID=754436 RepID=A0A090QRE0_9GAMM|nr:hypothetical protein JCM19237_1061 [Photobacterium aphoticum]